MDFKDIKESVQCGEYTLDMSRMASPPRVLPEGFITDRNKSVVWNEETVKASKQALKNYEANIKRKRSFLDKEFIQDLTVAVKEKCVFPLNDEQYMYVPLRALYLADGDKEDTVDKTESLVQFLNNLYGLGE